MKRLGLFRCLRTLPKIQNWVTQSLPPTSWKVGTHFLRDAGFLPPLFGACFWLGTTADLAGGSFWVSVGSGFGLEGDAEDSHSVALQVWLSDFTTLEVESPTGPRSAVCGWKRKRKTSGRDLTVFFSPSHLRKLESTSGCLDNSQERKFILTFQFLASFKFADLAFRLGERGGVFLLKRGPRGGNFTGIHVAVDFGLTSEDVLLRGRDWKNTDLVRRCRL